MVRQTKDMTTKNNWPNDRELPNRIQLLKPLKEPIMGTTDCNSAIAKEIIRAKCPNSAITFQPLEMSTCPAVLTCKPGS